MYTKILVALDGSKGAQKALAAAVELGRTFGAELHSLAVEGKLPAYAASIGEVDEAKAEKDAFFERIDREAVAYAAEHGVELHPVKMVGDPADRVVHYAEEGGFDLLVLAARGHSLAHRFHLTGTADKILDHSPCSTLLVR
jgi:nucleotide-binding universal stress UspA family protein